MIKKNNKTIKNKNSLIRTDNTTQKISIKLSSIRAVQKFVSIADGFQSDIYVASFGTYSNAKSILGIFAMDLSSPLDVYFTDSCGEWESFMAQLTSSNIAVIKTA